MVACGKWNGHRDVYDKWSSQHYRHNMSQIYASLVSLSMINFAFRRVISLLVSLYFISLNLTLHLRILTNITIIPVAEKITTIVVTTTIPLRRWQSCPSKVNPQLWPPTTGVQQHHRIAQPHNLISYIGLLWQDRQDYHGLI